MARMIEGYTVTSAKQLTGAAKKSTSSSTSTTKSAVAKSNAEFQRNASKNGASQRAAQEALNNSVPALSNSTALGSPKTSATQTSGLNDLLDNIFGSSSSGSGSRGGGGYSGGGSGAAAKAEDPYEKVMQLIRETTQANNEWSAQQAQKQMDFQERMARNAHTYEVEDLKNAGLNPVLSAGGNGAAVPSGAMGDTDTSNTRLLAEVAMESIEAMAITASGVSGVAGKLASKNSNSFLGKLTNAYTSNKLFKKVVDTGLSIGSTAARYGLLKAIL